jgi:hypothetical protein
VRAIGNIFTAELAHHDGHMTAFGCGICRIKTKRHDHHTCCLSIEDEIRSTDDFKDLDAITVSTIDKEEMLLF